MVSQGIRSDSETFRRALQQTSPSRPVHGVAVRALHSPTRVGQRCGVWNGGRKTTSGHTGQVQLLPGELETR